MTAFRAAAAAAVAAAKFGFIKPDDRLLADVVFDPPYLYVFDADFGGDERSMTFDVSISDGNLFVVVE